MIHLYRAVPFPWLGKVAMVGDGGISGVWDYGDDEITLYERDQWIPVADAPSFSFKNTSFMLAVVLSTGTDYLHESGICLVDPFSREAFGHIYFEIPIKTVVRMDETRFCVCFNDGSFEQLFVEGLATQ